MKKTYLLLFSIFLILNTTFAQKKTFSDPPEYVHDSTKTMMKKNVVRFNLTPYLLWGEGNYVFGYERRISDFQSVSLNAGWLAFPKIISLNLSNGTAKDFENKGFSIAADYRRYFKKRNRGFAPDGLYWGPYFTYYSYNLRNDISLDSIGGQPVAPGTSDTKIRGSLTIFNIGLELGYQFIVKKRLAIDLIMIGPGYGIYHGKMKINSDLHIPEEADILEEVRDGLLEKYPGLEGLLEGEEISNDGNFRTWTAGLRFVVQIGYTF